MPYNCKECSKEYNSKSGLHRHLKSHDMSIGDYYTLYYPRNDKYSGKPLPFKDYKQYFSSEFINKRNMRLWCHSGGVDEVRGFLIKKLQDRVADKGLEYAPCLLDLETSKMPTIFNYEDSFGSYQAACDEVGIELMFPDIQTLELKEFNGGVFIDSREQSPLKFKISETTKIDIGDYLLQDEYTYTYVDRKSFEDFRATLSGGFDRFCGEIERAIMLDSYLFVVVESSLEKSETNYGWKKKTAPLSFTYNRMREVVNKYPRRIQFVFSGSRERSTRIIPELLSRGKELWTCDIQRSLDGLD